MTEERPLEHTQMERASTDHHCEWETKYHSAMAELKKVKAQLPKTKKMDESGEVCAKLNPAKTVYLPVEMWKETFSHLTDPYDWLHCYNTCTYFQHIMEGDKVKSLLPEVIQVLSQHQKRYYPPAVTRDHIGGIISTSRRNFELTPEDLCNCRLVCKSWRNTINTYVSHHPSIQNLLISGENYVSNYREEIACALPIVLDAQFPEKIISILSHCENNRSSFNPLSSRHVVLKGLKSLGDDQGKKRKRERKVPAGKHPILTLLEKVGSSIWHFVIDNDDEEYEFRNDMINWHHAVVKCLHLLPNLKSLAVFQANNSDDVREPPRLSVPHFPHLTVIHLAHVSENVYKSIFHTNHHIEKLTMNLCGTRHYSAPRASFHNFVDFTNLTELSLGVFFDNDSVREREWNYLRRTQLPLTKLAVRGDPVCPTRLLRTLKRFKHTLTHLSVEELTEPISGIALTEAFPNLILIKLPE